ncbi:MAG: hypothetical protein ACW981_12615 [Candidatus Hodarchaeales archaeon]|jgi:hypothetical protein
MENNDFTTYMSIMTLMQNSGIKSYYARTKVERSIFTDLLKEGYVNRLTNTKYCYKLSSKGIEESTSIMKVISSSNSTSMALRKKDIKKTIYDSVLELITPIRPMAKIPDLWNYLQKSFNKKISKDQFEETILSMHKEGKLTLQSGFSINETQGGIKTLQGNSFYYVMIDN